MLHRWRIWITCDGGWEYFADERHKRGGRFVCLPLEILSASDCIEGT